MVKPETGYWCGVDLGGTKMLATVFDDAFRPLGRKRKRTRGHEGAETGLQRLTQAVVQAAEDAGVSVKQLRGVGVGCPGPVDMLAGTVVEAVNLGWEDVRLQAAMEEALECPVRVVNDVDAGVYAESRFGAGSGARCVLGVFPGTGIGGGCVYEGQILSGGATSGMEIGHIQVVSDGGLCGCGRYGCLETVASRLAIAAAAAQAAFRGEAPALRKQVGTDLSEIRSGALASAIAAGDQAIEAIVRQACLHLGRAIGNFVNLLVPEIVVLGGGLVEAMPQLFVQHVGESARQTAMRAFADRFRVVPAQLGDDASVLGAAAWAAHLLDSHAQPGQPTADTDCADSGRRV